MLAKLRRTLIAADFRDYTERRPHNATQLGGEVSQTVGLEKLFTVTHAALSQIERILGALRSTRSRGLSAVFLGDTI